MPAAISNEEIRHRLSARRGDAAWLDAPARRPRPGDPGFSVDGYELPDGGVLEWPDSDGRIRLRDLDGELVDWWDVGDVAWPEKAAIFGVKAEEFEIRGATEPRGKGGSCPCGCDDCRDEYVDYGTWNPNWEFALGDREVNCDLLPASLRDTIVEIWPEDYSVMSTWDLDGGPFMDRIARELTYWGYGHGASRPHLRNAEGALRNL